MKEDKSTPAIKKQEGNKTVYSCGKNAGNKKENKKPEVKDG